MFPLRNGELNANRSCRVPKELTARGGGLDLIRLMSLASATIFENLLLSRKGREKCSQVVHMTVFETRDAATKRLLGTVLSATRKGSRKQYDCS